jgi:hypothetical protein
MDNRKYRGLHVFKFHKQQKVRRLLYTRLSDLHQWHKIPVPGLFNPPLGLSGERRLPFHLVPKHK